MHPDTERESNRHHRENTSDLARWQIRPADSYSDLSLPLTNFVGGDGYDEVGREAGREVICVSGEEGGDVVDVVFEETDGEVGGETTVEDEAEPSCDLVDFESVGAEDADGGWIPKKLGESGEVVDAPEVKHRNLVDGESVDRAERNTGRERWLGWEIEDGSDQESDGVALFVGGRYAATHLSEVIDLCDEW